MSSLLDDETPQQGQLASAIETSRSDPDRWVRRARLSLSMGEFVQARDDLRRALELDPDHLEARLELLRVDASIDRLRGEVYDQDPWAAVSAHGPGQGVDDRRHGFFRTHLALTCPTIAAVEALVSWVGGQTVLELQAGRGLWSRLLADRGVEVLCSESSRELTGPTWIHALPFAPLKAVQTLVADVLLVDGGRKLDPDVLPAFRGNALVLLGHGDPDLEGSVRESWSVVHTVRVPSFTADHDLVRFFVRRPG